MEKVFKDILEYVDERLEDVENEYIEKESVLEDLENNDQPFPVPQSQKTELIATLEELLNTKTLLGCMKLGIKSIINENKSENLILKRLSKDFKYVLKSGKTTRITTEKPKIFENGNIGFSGEIINAKWFNLNFDKLSENKIYTIKGAMGNESSKFSR